MNRSLRLLGALVGVVAIGLTGLGVGLAATDSNSPSQAPWALHGGVAKTAHLTFTITTHQENDITGSYAVDFRNDDMAGEINVPTLFSTTRINFRVVNGVVYVGLPSLASWLTRPWIAVPLGSTTLPDLTGVAAELSKLKVDIGYYLSKATVTTSGGFTTYRESVTKHGVQAPSTLPIRVPATIHLTVVATVAGTGQFTQGSLTVSGKNLFAQVAVSVTNYNAPVRVTAPPANLVQKMTPQLAKKLTGSSNSPYAKLLTPQGLASLGQIRLG